MPTSPAIRMPPAKGTDPKEQKYLKVRYGELLRDTMTLEEIHALMAKWIEKNSLFEDYVLSAACLSLIHI